MNSCEYVMIHHTAFAPLVPQFNLVDGWHKGRGFPKSSLGFYVGYHYFIGFDGTIKVARAEWEIGAHCNAKMMNYRAIGICLAGDFTNGRVPTKEQIAALALLLKDVRARHQIPADKVIRHGDVKSTSCPGEWHVWTALSDFYAKDAAAKDHSKLQDRFEHFQKEYHKAITIPKRNHFQRILDRIHKIAVATGTVLR